MTNSEMDERLAKIMGEVYDIHLPYTEMDEAVMELIERAFRLGKEIGHEEGKEYAYELQLRVKKQIRD
jgi:hypothetical protein